MTVDVDIRTEVSRLVSRNIARMVDCSGLSWREIAERCGLDERTVLNWATGRAMPRALVFLGVCEEMGWSLDRAVGLGREPLSYPAGETTGERISSRIAELGMSRSAIASKVGIGRYLVDRWARDVQIPRIDDLAIMCWYMGVSAEYVLSGKGRHQYDDEPNYCIGCGSKVAD